MPIRNSSYLEDNYINITILIITIVAFILTVAELSMTPQGSQPSAQPTDPEKVPEVKITGSISALFALVVIGLLLYVLYVNYEASYTNVDSMDSNDFVKIFYVVMLILVFIMQMTTTILESTSSVVPGAVQDQGPLYVSIVSTILHFISIMIIFIIVVKQLVGQKSNSGRSYRPRRSSGRISSEFAIV